VLKEIPPGIFVLTFNYRLRQNKGIIIYINTNGKKQLLDKPSLEECAINSYNRRIWINEPLLYQGQINTH
jgi:hypothetical protein